MSYLDLFPLGADGSRILLPHQQEFLDSQAKYIGAVGGYGSGKTLAACIFGVQLTLSIPGNLGIVCRRSYSKLHDSTQRIFMEVLDRTGVEWIGKEQRDGWYHRIIIPSMSSEVVFRETKDIGRFLGPEYGWFYIDEAQEEPEDTFTKLMGRLRLPRAAQYLKGFLTTNPPTATHWFAKVFGEPGQKWRNGSLYHCIRSSSRQNPFLPEQYIKDLEANYPASEVKRIIEGFYGFSFEGRPVYAPPFEFAKHVGAPPIHPLTTFRAWDFGFRCPACTWHQLVRCRLGRIHWHTIAELVMQNLESEDFAREVLKLSKDLFKDTVSPHMWVDIGDAAGAQVSEKGPGPIIRLQQPPWNLKFRYRKIPNIDPGLDLVREVLRKPICGCGFPTYLVHRRCRDTIDMFAGGYHYARLSPGKARPSDEKPQKDLYYDNIGDTVRYFGELAYRMAARDPAFIRDLEEAGNMRPTAPTLSTAWMGE